TRFRTGLQERDLEYVVQVKGITSAQPAEATPVTPVYAGMGRPRVARYPEKPLNLRALALAAGRVRPANDEQRQDDGVPPERWLPPGWPEEKDEPVKYWLSNLPADTPLL